MCLFDCCFYNNEKEKNNYYLKNDPLEEINKQFAIIRENSKKKINVLNKNFKKINKNN
jgi:hypothetical protein